MATEPTSHPDDAGERPSERTPTPPAPGTADADFLANLNDVYGEESDQEEAQILAGIRRSMRDVLGREW